MRNGIERVYRLRASCDFSENPQPVQNELTRGLQENSRAYGPQGGRAFKQGYGVSLTSEQKCRGTTGHPVTDDTNAEFRGHPHPDSSE